MINFIRKNLGLKISLLSSGMILGLSLLFISVFSLIPLQAFSKLNFIYLLLTLMGLLILVGGVFVYGLVLSYVQRPIDRLNSMMAQAKRGDLSTRVTLETEDEVGQLGESFNQMFEKLSVLETRKMNAERDLVQAQEELKYHHLLEEKANIIEKTNSQLQRSIRDLSVLYQVSQMMSSALEPSELYHVLIEVVVKKMGFMEFALLLLNESEQRLKVALSYGFKNNDQIKLLSFSLGEGISGRVASEKCPIYIPNTSQDSSYLRYKGAKMDEGSFLSLPVISHKKILGVMNFSRPGFDSFSPQDIQLLSSLASQVAVALENTRLYSKMKELSVIDDLTHVYNRRHFHEVLQMELKRSKRFERHLSLLMIDVDHFKKFNDTFGHLNGDKVLVDIARLLSQNIRETDTVARFGGEEFAIILAHTNAKDARFVAEKLCRLIEKHTLYYNLNLAPQHVTVSIGVASYPEQVQGLEELISKADQALYQAKALGRNRVQLYSNKSSDFKFSSGQAFEKSLQTPL